METALPKTNTKTPMPEVKPPRPAATPEPAPTGDGDIVLHEAIKDLVARAQTGKRKYGTFLRAHNGRNATMDLHQELLDAVMYSKQRLMEQDDKGTPFREIVFNQIEFSKVAFGPHDNTLGLIDHIKKELIEVEQDPKDIKEWIDIIILAMDGAWRNGHSPEAIEAALIEKQETNKQRKWPDWRTATPGKAIEHIRSGDQR
jgi:hypothetical protein